jgi:hypothetical protein
MHYEEIAAQLREMGLRDGKDFFPGCDLFRAVLADSRE